MKRVVVIGAGIGGLTAAAILARAGFDVTVLEAHIYPGGCAGTFYHQGYHFDAGATLAGGFYPGGPMDRVAQQAGITGWNFPIESTAMVAHLSDGSSIPRLSGAQRHDIHQDAFGKQSLEFFRWQENTADALWDLALRTPPWLPQSPAQLSSLLGTGAAWLFADLRTRLSPGLIADALLPISHRLKMMPPRLVEFLDGQLLISAQTTTQSANALYAASALDLPRRGVVHVPGGIGTIARDLVRAVTAAGGKVFFRQEATKVLFEQGHITAVETKRGSFPADLVIANLTPWNLANITKDQALPALRSLPDTPRDGWGAFMLYLGVDQAVIPAGLPLHHQVIQKKPLGEGNSIFISLSPDWDQTRAPQAKRAITISTHTGLSSWWELYRENPEAYEARKKLYVKRILTAAERVLPGITEAADLVLPGTPVTFQRFTRRAAGWVGGFPQTNLFKVKKPYLGNNLWMVGDSIFPGQSTAAVALGGLRVARAIIADAVGTARPIDRLEFAQQ